MLTIAKAAPAALLDELKSFLRIENGLEDALLVGMLRASTEAIEKLLGTLLIEREVNELVVVRNGRLTLGVAPARALIGAWLTGADGEAQPIAGAKLESGSTGAFVVVAEGLPEASQVSVRYRAGLATEANGLPELIRSCVIRTAGHFHASRDGADAAGIPESVKGLLAPWRVRRL